MWPHLSSTVRGKADPARPRSPARRSAREFRAQLSRFNSTCSLLIVSNNANCADYARINTDRLKKQYRGKGRGGEGGAEQQPALLFDEQKYRPIMRACIENVFLFFFPYDR